MNYVIAICLVYMLAIFVTVVVRLTTLSPKARLQYLKNFKRGEFALIYVALIPLYFLAFRHDGASIDGSIWQAISACVETVILKYPLSATSHLMEVSLFYQITVELGFALVTLNALMFTLSLGGQVVLNTISLWITRLFRKKVVVVVGYNANSLDILKSVDKKIGKAVLIDKASPQAQDDAFVCRADYVSLQGEDIDTKLLQLFRKFDRRKISVILNCEDDSRSLLYVKQLNRMIERLNLTSLPLTDDCGLQVYVFGSKANESVFIQYIEQSKGLIKFVNRHEQIAMDFIKKYPMTQFMTEEQINYKTATIKENINLNIFMIGFGNLNETLFLTSVSNNQFLTIRDGKLQSKPVKYHIYDRHYPEGKIAQENESVYSRSLNHGYNRYREFLTLNKGNQNEYLEFVPEPAEVQFHPCDISHPKFYTSMHDELLKKNSYSYVIVSFGTDMENIELAKKLQQKFREWDIPSVVKIFVKVRDDKLVKEIRADFEDNVVQIFGTNRSCVYSAAAILNEKTEYMARLRHLLYTAEDEQKKQTKEAEQKQQTKKAVSLTEKTLRDKARDKWYGYKQCQRESNLYACLSIRMKLQLLGYDMAEDGKDCAKEFETIYEAGDTRTPSSLSVEGKQIWNYCNAEQARPSIRWTYAVQEHQRWCANMICNGVIPSDKEEIKQSGGRILDKRLHGNLTTMSGLVEYRNLVSEATGDSSEATDVIRYDYQLMDDVVWLLHKCGYKLIRK